MSDRSLTRTTCPYCGVGCGVLASSDGGVAGDRDHPANRGRLCSKGAALGETLVDADRLTHPEIDGRRAGWDEALDLIARQFSRTIAEHGPDSVAFYVSGQFLTEDYYVANKLMKGFIGSGNIDTNSRLCMASSVAGHVRAFGEDLVPACYDDLEAAELVVLTGSNLAWCHPVLYQRLAAAKETHGTRIVVIDPRRTATCEIADLHLAVRPGTDVVLFAGLLAHLEAKGACDRSWMAGQTRGFDEALDAARKIARSIAEVASITDVPLDDVARFFAWFTTTERTVTCYSQGVNQSSAGTDKVNAILNCHLATGRLGRPGMGPLSLTGQPNAMGGREVGGLANQLAAHMAFNDADIDRVRRFWNAPRMASKPGLKAVDLFDAMLDGRIKALWVLATNPADSMPRAGRVRDALRACPFVAVSDCWPTDTSRLAHVVLPAMGWGEKDGTVTNSERCISRQRRFRDAPGEARADWWMMAEVARRMGWAQDFAYTTSAEIFREHAALSAFENDGRRLFDIGALADLGDEAYDQLQPVQWPLRRGESSGAARLFDGPSGRSLSFVATPYRPVAVPASNEWPLVLNTGRIRDQWHTMTRTGVVARLMTHRREPALEIHPLDAQRFGIAETDLVRIESPHGTTVTPMRLSTDQRRGEIFVPMHWSDAHSSAGPVDRIVGAAADPVSGQPELKATPVRIEPVTPLWRALLLRADAALPDGDHYWSRVPVEGGHAFDLAGLDVLPEGDASRAWVQRLLGASPQAELVVYADPARATFRYAAIVGDRLEACLFVAREASALPDRTVLIAALNAPVTPEARLLLLSGCATSDMTDTGPVVCSCFGVGRDAVCGAIGRGASTVTAIGQALRAGTNCGSCIPELKSLLRELRAAKEPANA
ncbi:MAG TPA: molybdopterin-dependent oxidoreductase [Reyranella sp.]|nr:molybdopterin-dependent oxidoreductase [Reyranella sp.]